MKTPTLILITGLPATGKTTLGQHLAGKFGLPFFYKDGFKETLYDAMGEITHEQSRTLGYASFLLLYQTAEALLKVGQSLIVEANFDTRFATPQWQQIQQKYPFEPLQILCHAQGDVLLARFMARAKTGTRHAGHHDELVYREQEALFLTGRIEPLALGGRVIEVDTTDFGQVDYAGLYEVVERVLHNYNGSSIRSDDP